MTDAGASTAAFAFAALMGCGSPNQPAFSMESLLKPEISEFSPKANSSATEESTICSSSIHIIRGQLYYQLRVLYDAAVYSYKNGGDINDEQSETKVSDHTTSA
uniref:Lipoprotein n=1 Tax=Heterorhabditis bacteriophora TaxID=37862 RepID=A0A1I7X8U5_HETBA